MRTVLILTIPNINYNGFINQDLRLPLIGYGNYTHNGIEIQTYRFGIDNRQIQKNSLDQNNPTETSQQSAIETIETNNETNIQETPHKERDYVNFSILGGASINAKPIIDINIKFLINKYMFIVLQGGGTPVNMQEQKLKKILKRLLPENHRRATNIRIFRQWLKKKDLSRLRRFSLLRPTMKKNTQKCGSRNWAE